MSSRGFAGSWFAGKRVRHGHRKGKKPVDETIVAAERKRWVRRKLADPKAWGIKLKLDI